MSSVGQIGGVKPSVGVSNNNVHMAKLNKMVGQYKNDMFKPSYQKGIDFVKTLQLFGDHYGIGLEDVASKYKLDSDVRKWMNEAFKPANNGILNGSITGTDAEKNAFLVDVKSVFELM